MVISLTDSGSGIPEEIKSLIFEPFFTTKGEGQGTGLGLATCYGITKQNDGYIPVGSELNRGATFRIYLPAALEPATQTSASGTCEEIPRGTERALRAED